MCVGGRALPAPSAVCVSELLRVLWATSCKQSLLQRSADFGRVILLKLHQLYADLNVSVSFKTPWERPKVPWEEEKAFLGEGNGTDLLYSSRNVIPKELSYFIS